VKVSTTAVSPACGTGSVADESSAIQTARSVSRVINAISSAVTSGSSHGNSATVTQTSETETAVPLPNWATLSSSPLILDNRHASLQSTDDDRSGQSFDIVTRRTNDHVITSTAIVVDSSGGSA